MNHILVLIKANLLHLWNNWAADGYLMILEHYLSLVIVDIFFVFVDVFFNCGKTQNINVTILIFFSVRFSSLKYIPIVCQSVSRTLFILKNWNTAYIKQLSIPLSSGSWPPLLSFLSPWFDYSRCLVEVQSLCCLSLWLAYFAQHNVLRIHLCCNMCQNFLPFWGWIISLCRCAVLFRSLWPHVL